MRKNDRRYNVKSAEEIHEVRTMMTAFGKETAKKFGEHEFSLDPELVKVALSARHDRRQRLRRKMDRHEGTDPLPNHN